MNVLVVDDSSAQRAFWATALEKLGAAVIYVSSTFELEKAACDPLPLRLLALKSAEQALAVLKRFPVDVLITDVNLPGIDGWRLTSLAQRLQPRIAAVIFSSWVATILKADDANTPVKTYVVSKSEKEKAIAVVKRILGLV